MRLQAFTPLAINQTPSVLQPLIRLRSNLENKYAPKLWIKRDDQLGPGLGGNKGRALAYILADVLAKEKEKVTTYGGLQSNHARMTAAAAASLGLECHLLYFDKRPQQLKGNLLLSHLLGAKMHFIPFGSGSSNTMSLENTIRIVHLISKFLAGRTAYFIPGGGHSVIGCYGYVEAACEIHDQALDLGWSPDNTVIVTPVGTGGTLAGLMAGFKLLDTSIQVIGIDIGRLWRGFPASIAKLASATYVTFNMEYQFHAQAVPMIENTYVGKAYAHPTKKGMAAMRLLARTEGIILDPVYSGKAFAGMLDLIKKRRFSPDANIIFLHTGGFPAIWA